MAHGPRSAELRPISDRGWTVRTSHHVLTSRWLNLRSDACMTSSGSAIDPYYIVETPDFAHVLASDRGGRIVLVRQYRHGLGDLSLELPGGMVDGGETDILAVAARELREETGYVGGRMEILATLSPDPARYTNRIHFLRAYDVEPGPATPDPTEEIEVVLTSRAEALRLVWTGAIQNAPHACAILMGLRD